MKILIDIGHPAHVHLFKHFAHEMINKNHQVHFTFRGREFINSLLITEGFSFTFLGKGYKSGAGKIWGLFKFTWLLLLESLIFKPDIFLSHGSMYAAFTAFLLHKRHIAFEDTFNFEQIRLYKPFTKHILTSDYKHPLASKKVIHYASYNELAYLHPKRFTPDISVLNDLGVKKDEKFIIMRFVSWNASHDIGHSGLSIENKIKAINSFKHFARVFISSESPLSDELEKYRINIAPSRIHDALAYADLLFGESSTMAEEAALLGVPAIYIKDNNTIYTKHLEKDFGLMYNYSESLIEQLKAIEKGVEVLKNPSIKKDWESKRHDLLRKKIDLSGFLVWFIENYPGSVKTIKENPEYQYNFM